MESRTCEYCGVGFSRKGGKRDACRFCSRTCAFAAKAVGGWNRGLCKPRLVKLKLARKPKVRKVLRARPCKECQNVFTPEYGNKKRLFCSKPCQRRYPRRGTPKNSETRARHAGVPCDYSIRPLLVLARDGWKCQLCGCATPRRLRGTTHEQAPELDHIVPLGAGGGHTWENVQCACRACNSKKGNKPLGQQRLIA